MHDEDSMSVEEMHYALSRHIPDMKRGTVTFRTGYGELTLRGAIAERIAAVCEKHLRVQLFRAELDRGLDE